MRRTEDILLAVFVSAVVIVSIYIVIEVAALAAQVVAAIIAVVGTMVAAIAKHGFELEKQRRHAVYLEKQKAYSELLAKIGDFARGKAGAADALSSAHLASWAFGDLPVLEATNAFQRNPTQDTLLRLLGAMRKNLQNAEVPKAFMASYDAAVLFPTEERKGLP